MPPLSYARYKLSKCFKISLAVISLWSKDFFKCLSFKMEAVITDASGRESHSDLPLKPDQAKTTQL